ncbi:hypothetical protein P3L10_005482 [Capsicum annuum]|uniref:uncharacterized protein At4g18490 n=1 Tax=Capsicum annuum TaxID=4072 RepID=UPI0007BFA34D|nr:uncharacterized protein At4g18490 [Capsicum annuum]XP_016559766.1 uncharacterized protein At4g18490 [Capsicum annuum]XP_016559768.1 uncharacterized protein At4g18490 [Capsicum annuum]
MAESSKGASPTVKAKDKDSLLDLDIGNDFLKSFKSVSMGADDAMDFDFGPISKNKKKTFNFDKEDMDFTLDNDFGKISSFNIDMSDLDISSPCKKDRKAKETSKEESTVAVNKKKGDGFKFSFDFGLDNFGFGSSQESNGKAKNNQQKDCFSFGSSQESTEKAKYDQEKESSSSKRSGNEGSGSHLNKNNGSLEDGTIQKHTASEAGITSPVDSHIDIDKNHDTTKHSLPSNHTMSSSETSKLQSASNEVSLEKAKSSLQAKISTSTQETVCQVEEGTSLISQSESRRNNSSSLQEPVNSVAANVSFLGVGTDTNKKVFLDSDTNYDESVLESSSLEDVATSMKNSNERRNFDNDEYVLETNKNRTETQSNGVSNATEDKMQDMKVDNEIQNPTSELSASSLSKIVADNLTAETRRETGVIRSKFFMPSITNAAQMQMDSSLTGTKVPAFSNKRIGPIPQSHPAEIISQDNKDDDTGSKAGSSPDSRPLLMVNPLQTGSQEGYQVLGTTIKGSQSDGAKNIRTLTGKSAPVKSKASSKDLLTFSSRVNPPSKNQQMATSTPRSIAIPRNVAPIPTAKNTLKEGDKALPIKAARSLLETSSLKTSAKLGTNPETPQTVLQKNLKYSKTVNQHGGFKAILQSKDNSTETLKQMPVNLSMKRKVPETNSDLMILLPSKRLSQSPNGNRGSSEGTERICNKQINDHEHSGNGNKTREYENSQMSLCNVPMRMNIKELGSPTVREDDDNIKKAQLLSKDLENICNMLRKKHEEAKELLVRAVVNNNKLLLLNHPIYEEKIHKVQKFAAGLMTRNHQIESQ